VNLTPFPFLPRVVVDHSTRCNGLFGAAVIPRRRSGRQAGRTLPPPVGKASAMYTEYPAADSHDSQHQAWMAASEAGMEHNSQHQALGLGPDFREAWASGWSRVLLFPFDAG
jgi:hypothetical protein